MGLAWQVWKEPPPWGMRGKAGLDMHRRLCKGGGCERGSASRTQETPSQRDQVWKFLKLLCSLLGQRPQGKRRPWGQRGCVETPVTQTASQGFQWDQDKIWISPAVLWAV